MVYTVSPLLPPSQIDLSDTSTWTFDTAQARSTHNNSYDLLVPKASKSTQRSSTPVSSTAYELSHIDSVSQKETSTIITPASVRSSLASWSLEIGAMLLSMGSIIAIVAVLYRENDKSLSRWPLAVSLNTVVSTLGTLARVTLAFALSACVGQQKWNWLYKRSDRLVAFERFDEAAKGPWGGARLFVWLRARHWAALGALVIMGTIAFDPFLQAVITVEGRSDDVTQSSNATIARASGIRGGTFTFETNQGSIVQNATHRMTSFLKVGSRPDFGVVSSFSNGLRTPSTPLDERPDFTCATGNCTWPTYTSAAMCSSCVDVSSGLKASAEYGLYGVSIPWNSMYGSDYEDYYTIWSLPTANIRNYNGRYNPENRTFVQTTLVLNTTIDATETIAHRELEAMLMAFTVIKASPDFLTKEKTWSESRPGATECALFFCTNAYQAVSINNMLKEELVGSWSRREPQSYKADYSYYTTPVDWDRADKMAADLGKNLYDRNNLHLDLQLTIPPGVLDNSTETTQRFNVSQGFIVSTIGWLLTFASIPTTESGNTLPWKGLNNVGYPADSEAGMPLLVDALWNSTNLTTTFDNVARSMTNQIRNTSPDEHRGALGTWTIHVRVNWWYLTFPIAMLTLGVLYVVLVIIESTNLRIPVWKESARPTLLYGFSDETQQLLRAEHYSKERPLMTVRYRVDEKSECLRLMADETV